jgi:hypothetical protein
MTPERCFENIFIITCGFLMEDDRTIILRRTSKKVQGEEDKMRLPDVDRLRRSFLYNYRCVGSTTSEKLQFVLRKITLMTV